MNSFQSKYKPPAWLFAFALSGLVVGCGSGGGDGAAAVPPAVSQAGGVCSGAACVDLKTAGSFVILAQAGVTNVPSSPITGNVGVHPITGAAIGVTCAEVSGTIYDTDGAYTGGGAADVTCRTTNAALLDTAVNDSIAAYVDAAGRPAGAGATNLNRGGGTLTDDTLVAGTYTWTTTLDIPTNLTLSGSATDVWILQISGNLNQAAAMSVNLTGGAQSKNVFWQVGGGTTSIGSTAHFAGIVITGGQVVMGANASLDGRLYTGTIVTLDHNTVTRPAL
jgi:ice-binding like protein